MSSSKNTRNQDGGNSSDWAKFPASENVDMNSKVITNLAGLNGSQSQPQGYVLTIGTGNTLVWSAGGGGGGVPSAWAQYPAVQDVDISNYSLKRVNDISLAKLNGASFPASIPPPLSPNVNYVLTASSTPNRLIWRRPPMATQGQEDPSLGPTFGISGDVYFKIVPSNAQTAQTLTLFFA